MLRPWARTVGSWSWSYDGEDRPFATIGYEADLTDESDAWLRLHYRANGEPLDYKIVLVTTIPNYGGRRWWFICPLPRDDREPPHRVAKLYLPPGERYFGSRHGHALTYTSCQESGKYDRLFASMGAIWAMLSHALLLAQKAERPAGPGTPCSPCSPFLDGSKFVPFLSGHHHRHLIRSAKPVARVVKA